MSCALRSSGVSRDDPVYLCLPRGPELVVAWLAAWVGRRDSMGLAVLLGCLGVLALGVAIFALVWTPS